MRIKVNLDEVRAENEPIPNGRYAGVIEKVYSKMDESTGIERIVFQIQLTENPVAGKRVWYTASMDKLERLKAVFVATKTAWNKDGVETDDLVNKEILVKLSTDAKSERQWVNIA